MVDPTGSMLVVQVWNVVSKDSHASSMSGPVRLEPDHSPFRWKDPAKLRLTSKIVKMARATLSTTSPNQVIPNVIYIPPGSSSVLNEVIDVVIEEGVEML